jgi:DNA repair protein RAD5
MMGLSGHDGPPAKRRRFFSETSADSSTPTTAPPGKGNALAIDGGSEVVPSNSSTSGLATEDLAFDQQTLSKFVGEAVSADDLRKLHQASNGDLEKAINLFLDGFRQGTHSASLSLVDTSHKIEEKDSANAQKCLAMPDARYVGAFGVGAWATKSGVTMTHGESVRIERQKIQSNKVNGSRKGKSGTLQASLKPNSAAAKRVDVVVRFTNAKGEEIGRIPKEVANWDSVLVDQKICKFEGRCVSV